MILLDGKKLSLQIADELKKKVEEIGFSPVLAIVQIGDIEETNAYVRHKKIFAEKIGATILHVLLPENVTEELLLEKMN